MTTQTIEGVPSWHCVTPAVDAAISVAGAMIAPVNFSLPGGRTVAPFYLNPWRHDTANVVEAIDPPVLQTLRGDFFCLPFGGDNHIDGEDHQPHGEAAGKPWTLIEQRDDGITCAIDYTATSGRIERELRFGTDAPWILSTHRISGFSGSYPLGLHATLEGGAEEGRWEIQTAPFDLGMTDPGFVEPTANGEYSALEAGAHFDSLERVPTRWKEPEIADCSRFPARHGFVDILGLYRRRTPEQSLAERLVWTVAINRAEGYLWYSIKDASVLPGTVFWMENGGRHGAPWSGRNSCIGIEETCSFLASGRRESVATNAITRTGIATAVALDPAKPTVVSTVGGVLPLPSKGAEPLRVTGLLARPWRFALAGGGELPIPAPLDLLG